MFLLIRVIVRWWQERQTPVASDSAVAAQSESAAPAGYAGAALEEGRAARVRAHAAARKRSAAARGLPSLLGHQVAYDLRISMRNPRARFFTVVFPVLLLVIFTGVFGHGTTVIDGVHVKLSRFYVAGILALSVVVAGYANLVVSISSLRETGVLKRRRSTPVPPVLLIASQAITVLVTVAIMAVVLLVLGKLLYGVGMAPAALLALACTTTVGAFAFACIGYAVSGLIGSPDAAQPIVQATMMPMWFISGVFIPTHNLSGTLRTVGSLFPVEHLAAGLQLASVHSSFGASISLSDLLVLAAWGLAAAAFAAWRFSWLPSAAKA